jgi:hypothetical protein
VGSCHSPVYCAAEEAFTTQLRRDGAADLTSVSSHAAESAQGLPTRFPSLWGWVRRGTTASVTSAASFVWCRPNGSRRR